MRLMLLSEEKISATGLGRIGHFSGIAVLEELETVASQLDDPGIFIFRVPVPDPSVSCTSSGRC